MPRLTGASRDHYVRLFVPLGMLAGILTVIVRMTTRPLGNPDTYVHLRIGSEFLRGNWDPGSPGTVTSAASADWVPTQWLAQMLMAGFEDWFGLAGVAWLSGLQMTALVVTLYWVGRREADPLAVVPVVILAVLGCTPGLSMRPQVLSYLLFAVVVRLLLDGQRDGRPRWIIVPLVAVWACLHGMWPVAIVLALLSAAGLALDRTLDARRLLAHAAIPFLAAVAACLTPTGPAIYSGVLGVVGRRDYFTEWGPPDFTAPSNLAIVAMLVLTVALSWPRRSWAEGLVLLALAGLLLYSTRTVPLAAAGLVPFTAAALQEHLGERLRVERTERWSVTTAWVLSLAVLALIVPTTADQPPPRPEWLEASVEALPDDTLVLTDSIFGGYLMWRYPHVDPLMHGYADTFTDAELRRNLDIRALAPGWDQLVDDTGVEYAIVDPESALGYALETDPDWEVVHRSDDLEMLARRDLADS